MPKSQKDLGSWPRSWRILGPIFLGGESCDIGRCHGKIAVESYRDVGSRIGKILLDSGIHLGQVIVGSCRSWILHNDMSLYREDPLHSVKFCFLVPHNYELLKRDH